MPETDSSYHADLAAAVERRRDELISLTQDLIRIPTINPPGAHYHDICTLLEKRLAASGFECQLLRATETPGDSDRWPRWNLVGRLEGSRPGPAVHFNGHTDVVELGEGWTVDPFEASISNGRIYGRGACDMKGGIATAIIAIEAFLDIFPEFPGSICFSATADEETGGYGGVAWLDEQGWFSPANCDFVIIPEPLNKDRICLGHRGVWWTEIETHGRIAHGSMPFLGDSAIRHMSAVLKSLEEDYYPKLANRRTSLPVVPDGARQATLNINSIHGGETEWDEDFTGLPAACVADRCRLVLDRRFLPEENLEEVKAELHELLEKTRLTRPGFSYSIRELFCVMPSMTEPDSIIVKTLEEEISRVLGRDAEQVLSPGTYDQKHIDRMGRLNRCVAYGPGILDLAHQPDEYIEIDAMTESACILAATTARLLSPDATGL